jgi:hypothetical protein
MIRGVCLFGLLTSSLLLAQQGGELKPKDGGAPAPVAMGDPQLFRLAPSAKAPRRALEYSLLVEELDKVPGNSAPLWLRAGGANRSVRFKWTEAQEKYLSSGPEGTPLKDLPKKDVQDILEKHASALRLAELATLRRTCDWGHLPLTIQNINDLPFDEIQMNRELIRLISLRCRLHLSQDRFEDALKDLRVGLRLTRDVGTAEFLIQDLVAIAIGTITLSRVEEWIERPGSPNLYWALTELPTPFVDTRHSIKAELGTIYRSFPALRDLKAKKLTASEAEAIATKFFQQFEGMTGSEVPALQRKLGITAITMKYYPTAKKALIERGRTEKEVEAMPAVQVVALYNLEEYDRVRDELVKWFSLPTWQSVAEVEKIEKRERARLQETGNIAIAQLMPSMVKVFHAQMRFDRHLASLRATEALRMHIAKHGNPPAKWADITDVPLPIDPITGKGFDAWYSLKDGKAILDVPPPPGMPGRLGKRFEYIVKAS